MPPSPIEVLIVDDNPKDIQRVRLALGDDAGPCHLHVIDAHDTLAYLRQQPPFASALTPDVIVLAVNPPAMRGNEVFDQIRQVLFHPPIIILGDVTDGPAGRYLHTGASDYVLKDNLRPLFQAVEQVVAARRLIKNLSRRQVEVLRLIGDGFATRDIAAQLEVAVKTVEAHRSELMRRLGIGTIAGLVRYALRIGLAKLAPSPPSVGATPPAEPTELS